MVSEKRVRPLLNSVFHSRSEKETLAWAKKFARRLGPGDCVALTGTIGSGKTFFIKGLAGGLGVKNRERVKSPTFVLLHLYEGKFPVRHFDLYRLEREGDLDAIGFEEFARDPESLSLVEWADRAAERIPQNAFWLHFEITGPHSRKITVNR